MTGTFIVDAAWNARSGLIRISPFIAPATGR